MASLVDAFDITIKEALAGVKILLWAMPLTYISLNTGPSKNILAVIFAFFVIGLVVTMMHNIIKKNSVVVPGLNFVTILMNGFAGVVAMAPYVLLSYLIYYASGFISIPSSLWDTTLKITIYSFALSLPFTALCIVSRRLNPLEAFNVKKFVFGVWEVFLSYTTFCIKLLVCMIIVLGFIVYLFELFIGFKNAMWNYLVSSCVMFFIFLFSNALAQISEEIYTFPEKEETNL